MKAIAIVTLTAAALIGSAGLASAQKATASQPGINPQCMKFGGQARGCTCALETGGEIRPDGRWHYNNTPRWTGCMSSKGWM